jgi:hypothetical protein
MTATEKIHFNPPKRAWQVNYRAEIIRPCHISAETHATIWLRSELDKTFFRTPKRSVNVFETERAATEALISHLRLKINRMDDQRKELVERIAELENKVHTLATA